MPIRVQIAEDDPSLRKWYAFVLEKAQEIELLPMASSGYEAVALAAIHKPDVVILDIEMESHDAGLQAGAQIMTLLPSAKIIMLTVYDDDATIFRAYEMGAVDYLIKDASVEKIISAIQDAHNGTSPIRKEIAQRMRQEFRRLKQNEDSLLHSAAIIRRLSNTESSIVVMLAKGMSRTEICDTRYITMSTLKTHIRNILQKMQLPDTNALVALVQRENLLPYLEMCAQLSEENNE